MLNEDRSVGQQVTSPVPLDYQDMTLRAITKGNFTQADIDLNDIEVTGWSVVPKLVLEFEMHLSLKQRPKDTQVSCICIFDHSLDLRQTKLDARVS